MNVDADTVWNKLTELTVSSDRPSVVMRAFVETCSATYAHADWEHLMALDYDDGVDELEAWLVEVLGQEPPPRALNAIWVGLFNPAYDDDMVSADMYISGTDAFDAESESMDWTCDLTWRPEHGAADSSILDEIYTIAYEAPDGLGNDAEWSVCLMFAVTAVRSLLARSAVVTLFPIPEGGLPVFVGFDDGDFVNVGTLLATGWLRPG